MDPQNYVQQIQNQQDRQNGDGRRRDMELAALAAVAGQNQQQPPPRTCPRCNSDNTKFCYFNNYSLSQPRYFCKGCRRYWTHGGTLRNVPVGGSSRKSKRGRSSASSSVASPPPQPTPAAGPQAPASGGAISVLAPSSMMSPNHFPVQGGVGGEAGFFSSLVAGQSMNLVMPQPNIGSSSANMSFLQGRDLGAFGRRDLPAGWNQSFIGDGTDGDGNAPPATATGTDAHFWTIGGALSGAASSAGASCEQGGGGGGTSSNPNQWPDFPGGDGGVGGDR